uniref:High-affnity carbon uptake protein Hat/HatR n=1 Tax=uncultured Armatimonadetes bacterium TaxID=157466 RepID=A0A6J4HCQ7_9BACT|nr:High-affnity carbon uptake protein Hat/HatR [uncultured Armatimonadetes bacterium]
MKSIPIRITLTAAGLVGGALLAGCPVRPVQPDTPQGPVTPAVQGGSGLSSEAKVKAMMATVKVWIYDRNDRNLGSGSGTVISNDGLIITNWHCVGDTDTGQVYHPMGYLVVGPTKSFREPAVPTYIAQVRAGDPKNDVAILQIVGLFNGQQLQPAPAPAGLSLTPIKVGDANKVDIGSYVAVIGYPGVGGDTITLTDGKVAGVEDFNGDGVQDSFKTDAQINSGNSGGLACNAEGEQIGIPSNTRGDARKMDMLHYIRMVSLAAAPLQQAMTSPMQFPQGGQQPAPPQPTPPQPTPPQPTPPQPAQGGMVVQGKIVDADTKQPIPGALFLVLKPGATVEQFQQAATKDERLALLAAAGATDQSGAFQTTALPGGQKYTAIVGAEGYRPRAFVDAVDLPAGGTVFSIGQAIELQRAQ